MRPVTGKSISPAIDCVGLRNNRPPNMDNSNNDNKTRVFSIQLPPSEDFKFGPGNKYVVCLEDIRGFRAIESDEMSFVVPKTEDCFVDCCSTAFCVGFWSHECRCRCLRFCTYGFNNLCSISR
ncbi:unnamed protein product [Didymodactylos carnosus]|uniref:Uncharacterized protein n=1 Tax=Didymodactylos carnosus TaxID=1234261 RepID=A0A814N223_9BILA|nr:unnamed protein product [Didymodactylos carnosus]CAF3852339.1 unnamed protein product [Didymodactylos carnosus]